MYETVITSNNAQCKIYIQTSSILLCHYMSCSKSTADRLTLHGFYLHFHCIPYDEGYEDICSVDVGLTLFGDFSLSMQCLLLL